MTEAIASRHNVAAILHLELVFEFARPPTPEFFRARERDELGIDPAQVDSYPRFRDFSSLLSSIAAVAAAAGTGSIGIGRSEMTPIKRLQFGSPFEIELILGYLTIPGLAALLFVAKRLYGIDLEFKAYREKRRVEYFEARELAEQYETKRKQPPEIARSLELGTTPNSWNLRSGAIREDPD